MKLRDVTPGTWITILVVIGGLGWGGIKTYFAFDEALRYDGRTLLDLREAIEENEAAIDDIEAMLRGGK